MNIKPKNMRIGDVYRGLQLISNPYKKVGFRDHYADVKCIFCGTQKTVCLSELKRQVFDGCGCQKTRKNSINWKSFKTWCEENESQDVLSLWDYALNDKNPDDVSACTANKYYFKCPHDKHPSTQCKLINLTRRPKIRNICRYCNSVAQHLINTLGNDALNKYWDSKLNDVDPWDMPYGAHLSVFFKCEKHGSFQMRPKVFFESAWKCSECAREHEESSLQYKVNKYIADKYNIIMNHEYNCTLQCVNPNNNYILPYDNEIIDWNMRLIIEVNGIQHYQLCGLTALVAKQMNISKREAFENQQWRDCYKKDYAISQGYYYLEIPYWTEKDGSYKTLIDNKIHEILSLTQQND